MGNFEKNDYGETWNWVHENLRNGYLGNFYADIRRQSTLEDSMYHKSKPKSICSKPYFCLQYIINMGKVCQYIKWTDHQQNNYELIC